jgi:uncharacterized protein
MSDIDKTRKWVKKTMWGEASGHDWFHVERVYTVATTIAQTEKSDLFIVQMTALLHDIDDPKLNDPKDQEKALEWMCSLNLDNKVIATIADNINQISFSKNKDRSPATIEAAIVQDADRLDAIGAIGIARCFAYGGFKGRILYNPADLIEVSLSSGTVPKNENPSSLLHFYEKLLLIKDLMNTKTGKELAKGRHDFLEVFLDQFFQEWNGKA